MKRKGQILGTLNLIIECGSVYVQPKKYIYKKKQKWVWTSKKGWILREKSIELHELWSKSEQSTQSMSGEFPCKQMTNICGVTIVLAWCSKPQLVQKLIGHMISVKPWRMSTTLWPINPCQGSVRVSLPKLDADKCGQVVFITVAIRVAVL